ncbi:MAG TPA: hypothetical protein VJ876_09010 [Bacteroidales bacterium]|nr:hypothetical protein [Bacteroidales bacterium]
MKKQKASTQKTKKSGKGWKVIKDLKPGRKPMAVRRKGDDEH